LFSLIGLAKKNPPAEERHSTRCDFLCGNDEALKLQDMTIILSLRNTAEKERKRACREVKGESVCVTKTSVPYR